MADNGRLDELKRKFDENPRRYFAPLANEYRKAGEFDRAIELCRAYLPHQPGHMSGYIVYGQSLFDAGRGHEAAEIFQQALHLDPENIIALRHLGDIARLGWNNDLAMQWYGRVLELDPKNEEITAYITGLVTPGGSFAAPRQTPPVPQTPPAVRPEPEHDPEAVALADLVEQPDVPQPSFEALGLSATQRNQEPEPVFVPPPVLVEQSFDIFPTHEPSISEFLIDRSENTFEYVPDDVAAREPEMLVSQREDHEPFDLSPPITFDVSAPEDVIAPAISEADAIADLQAMERSLHDDREEASASASASIEYDAVDPTQEPFGQAAAEVSAPPRHAQGNTTAEVLLTPTYPTLADPVAADPVAASYDSAADDSAALEPVTDLGAPFITETMAALYLQQGFIVEALDVYRKLAMTRDEPKFHDKVRELELQLASQARDAARDTTNASAAAEPAEPRESVREFFARLGARKPEGVAPEGAAATDVTNLASPNAEPASSVDGLESLFQTTSLDAQDVRSADALANAFARGR